MGVKCQVEVGPGDGKTLSPQRARSMGRHARGALCLLASLEFCPSQALVENWRVSPITPRLLAKEEAAFPYGSPPARAAKAPLLLGPGALAPSSHLLRPRGGIASFHGWSPGASTSIFT